MKRILTLLICAVFLTTFQMFGNQQESQIEMKVRAFISSPDEISKILTTYPDIVYVEPGRYIDLFISQSDYQKLLKYDLATEILIPDLTQYYSELMAGLEDFGPYYTYQETTERLDLIQKTYPSITKKVEIGKSWEGRSIWAFKISDHPEKEEKEVEILFTGLHHAREPVGVSICLDFIEYLCREYQIDNKEVKKIVNKTQLWFVPIINPDGYVYNETYSSMLWRKNKREEPGSVDLNRNYPFQWGCDDIGSSPDPWDETYRGPEPASEPEVQAIINFCQKHHFYLAINYHSYGNQILYPWGYTRSYTPDHEKFRKIAEMIRSINHYENGTISEQLYLSNGDAIDWMYGWAKIFAFTLEVGEDFWQPDEKVINQQVDENIKVNLMLIGGAIEAKRSLLSKIFSKILGIFKFLF